MSNCTDKRFEKMLYAYELNLLSDEERAELEQHQLECDSCFERARSFRDAATLLEHDPLVKEAVQQLAGEDEEGEATIEPVPTQGWWSNKIRTYVVAAAVLLLLIVRPWRIVTDEPIAADNRLVVMYFENLNYPDDERRVGQLFTSLLTADLSESKSLQVVSSQRIYDILRLIGREDVRTVDPETATEVAIRAEAQYMLTGNVVSEEPNLVVSGQLVEVSTGNVMASQQIEGRERESIFSIVDRFTIEVRDDLALPGLFVDETDSRIADVTTHSPEAYGHYLDGVEASTKMFLMEADEHFRKALEHDSTFAMAYYHLAQVVPGGKDTLIERAMRYSSRASRKEQRLIESRDRQWKGEHKNAIFILEQLIKEYPDDKDLFYNLGFIYQSNGTYDKSIYYFNKAIAIDPLYRSAINQLAYVYQWDGHYEKGVEILNRYIAAVPDEPNPYDSRAEILGLVGEVLESEEAYKKAVSLKPDFYPSVMGLARLYLYTGRFDEAEKLVSDMAATDPDMYAAFEQQFRGVSAMYQGRFGEALEILEPEMESTKKAWLDKTVGWYDKRLIRVRAHWERKEWDEALSAISSIRVKKDHKGMAWPASVNAMWVQILIDAGRMDEAVDSVTSWKSDSAISKDSNFICLAEANLALARGDLDTAIILFDRATWKTKDQYPKYMMCRVLIEKGAYGKALKHCHKLLHGYKKDRSYWDIWDVKCRYYLARALEGLDDTEKAIFEYEQFLAHLKNAEPGIAEVDDARQRLARLKSSS